MDTILAEQGRWREKFSVKRHPKKGMLGKWETIRKLFDYTLHFAIYYEICPV